MNGIHPATPQTKEVYLTKGYHKLEIFYADRAKSNALFDFKPDNRLKFYPLPEGCEIEDVLDYNNLLTNAGVPVTGMVLGVSTADNRPVVTPASPYVCNPNLGYTKMKALYKTTDSPDVWTILETGQKHYITSPQAFNKYQCDWSKIKTVARSVLDQYPNANLVRTPDNPTVYYLFQRPQTKWLKRNVPSPTVFISYPENFWGNVARLDILDIQSYPDAQLIKTQGKPEVYLTSGQFKRHIKNVEVFERLGYDWAEVVTLSQVHLDSFEDGQLVD